jgi:PAS domain S-box-containing protein
VGKMSGSRAGFLKFAVPLALLGAGVLAAGFSYYRHQIVSAHAEAGRHVSSIADLKVDQIATWREERLADGRFFYANPLMGGAAREMVEAPSPRARAGVLHWINPLKENHDYSAIFLLDKSGNLRLALGTSRGPLEGPDLVLSSQVVASRQVAMSDIHFLADGTSPHLDVAVPLREGDAPGAPVFGVLLFRIDPDIRLFPVIQEWPIDSPTAETLLVRRDGDQVVFLNSLRHYGGAPLNLRIPLTDTSLPAVRAVQGESGIVTGRDYRHVPVIAAIRTVPGSPWYVISKIDVAEIERPVREHAVPLFGLVTLLLVGMGAIAFLYAGQQSTQSALQTLQAEAERRALTEHLDLLARYANDIILLAGPDGRIVEANDRAVAAYGYPLATLRGLPLRDLNAPMDAAVAQAMLDGAPDGSGTVFESVHRRNDGSTFPVEVSARMIDGEGRRYVQAIVRDITERRASEEHIARLNRAHSVLSHSNQAIVRLHDRQKLFDEACRIGVEDGGLRLAWIGLNATGTDAILPVAIAGHDDGYVGLARISIASEPQGRGPVGTSFREARPAVSRDIATDPAMAPWRDRALERGYRSCASFPLVLSGKPVGVLVLYSSEVNAFDAEEVKLFDELAADLSFAMETLDKDARRVVVEAALQGSERRNQAFIENSFDLITILDADATMRFQSPSIERILGYRAEELIGVSVFEYLHPDDIPRVAAAFEEGLSDEGNTATVEYRFRHKDGSWRVFEATGRNLLHEPGFQGILVNSWDITARRTAEDALRLRSGALEAAANGVVITNIDGAIVWVNSAVTRLTGYTESELIGQNPRLLKSGRQDEAFYRELWATIVSGSTWHGEVTNRRKDGTLYEEELSITPVRDASGSISHFVAIKQDITGRKASEAALLDANGRLQKALADLKSAEGQVIQQERLRALGTMASGVAHDFNNALVPILGFSELLLHHPDFLQDGDKARRYLQSMNTAANDAARVVSRLREFYRHRDADEAFTAVNLDRLVQEAVTLTQPRWKNQAEADGVEIKVVTDLREVPSIVANSAELREAMTNLIFNAVDAMPRGGTLTLRTRVDGARAVVEIVDDGIGMTEETRRRCLEPFFSTKGEHGTGLGLSMVYGIVQRHDGTVEIDSRLGRGTTFRLWFPLSRKLVHVAAADAAPRSVARLRVLIVDDQRSVRNLLGEFLAAEGHEVAAAENGPEGLDLFSRTPFDLVIVDRAMPELSGDEVAAAVKAANPGTPVIMLTGFGGMMDSVGEVPLGVDVLLGKPVTLAELRGAIARACGVPRVGAVGR